MKHTMNLDPKPFEMIQSGRKTIELRLYDEKRQQISIGDEIVFINTNNKKEMQTKVLSLHIFPSFDELYATLPLLKCGYTEETLPTASPKDMGKFYSAEQQKQYGVIGIEIELC